MNQRSIDAPEQVRKIVLKEKPSQDPDATDQAGHALVAMLQQAANLSNDKRQRHRCNGDHRRALNKVYKDHGISGAKGRDNARPSMRCAGQPLGESSTSSWPGMSIGS